MRKHGVDRPCSNEIDGAPAFIALRIPAKPNADSGRKPNTIPG